MYYKNKVALVTGGASGLGKATVRELVARGAQVVVVDLPGSDEQALIDEMGRQVTFIPADITSEKDVRNAVAEAEKLGALRFCVHCAGIGGPVRILSKDGSASPTDHFEKLINVNLIGTYNVLRLVAESMAKNEPENGDCGAITLTASVAAFEGQIGQIGYTASKAGTVGMTLVAARDLASRKIRVNTIAPGIFATEPLMEKPQAILDSLVSGAVHPKRMGEPAEYGLLACQLMENSMMNGETVRLDGAMRMAPR